MSRIVPPASWVMSRRGHAHSARVMWCPERVLHSSGEVEQVPNLYRNVKADVTHGHERRLFPSKGEGSAPCQLMRRAHQVAPKHFAVDIPVLRHRHLYRSEFRPIREYPVTLGIMHHAHAHAAGAGASGPPRTNWLRVPEIQAMQ